MRLLLPFVDYFSLMSYDYPSKTLSGVAPINWMRDNVEYLLQTPVDVANAEDVGERYVGQPLSHRVLMGLNLYGYGVIGASGRVEAVVAHTYLNMLTHADARIKWHAHVSEHSVEAGKSMAFYPSLHSLEMRLSLARELNVGVALWEIGQGLDYFYNLL